MRYLPLLVEQITESWGLSKARYAEFPRRGVKKRGTHRGQDAKNVCDGKLYVFVSIHRARSGQVAFSLLGGVTIFPFSICTSFEPMT